jgi:hypothetical protein
LRFLESPDFQPSIGKKVIDQKFVLQVPIWSISVSAGSFPSKFLSETFRQKTIC